MAGLLGCWVPTTDLSSVEIATREPTPDRSYNHEELPWQEEVYIPPDDDPWGYRRIWLDFYATLRHGAPLAITPESVRRELAVLDACRASSQAWD